MIEIIDYVNFHKIFKKIKDNHLEIFPTKEDYKNDLDMSIDVKNFIDDLYYFLENENIDLMDGMTSDEFDDSILKSVFEDNTLMIEFSIGGNDANESTQYNYWGYGFQFTIDLENEIFINFEVINYS